MSEIFYPNALFLQPSFLLFIFFYINSFKIRMIFSYLNSYPV